MILLIGNISKKIITNDKLFILVFTEAVLITMAVKYAKQFTCPECEWTLTSETGEDNIMKHFMVHKDQAHPNAKYDDEELKGHMADFYLGKQIKCPNCSWTMVDTGGDENLLRHMMIHGEEKHPEEKWTPYDLKPLIEEVHLEIKEKKAK
jgi:membrane-associated PAP2 superfamily phosphatase